MSSTARRSLFLGLVACGLGVVACNEHPLEPLGDTLSVTAFETSPRIGSNEVDILWVVDSSISMREEQAELGARFDEFAAALADLDADFRMAVVTTDTVKPATRGRFQTGPGNSSEQDCRGIAEELRYCDNLRLDEPYLQAADYRVVNDDGGTSIDAQALSEDFRCIASAGDCGAAVEQGLSAVELALSPDMLATANGDFLRDDAFLVVIFLTDEDDCSNDDPSEFGNDADCYARENRTGLSSVQSFFDSLVAVKGGAEERILIAGLIGPDDGLEAQTEAELNTDGPRFSCVSALGSDGQSSANARDGERYRELISLVGSRGIEESVCQGDFSAALTNIGEILRENLDVNCFAERPRTCETKNDCREGDDCIDPGDGGGDAFCGSFEVVVEILEPGATDFRTLDGPGPVSTAENPFEDADFFVDYDSEVCLHGIAFGFAPGARPGANSRYRLSYPRSTDVVSAGDSTTTE